MNIYGVPALKIGVTQPPTTPVNTTKKGDALEIAVFDLLKAQIDADRFFAKKECCSIFRRKGYYSEKRKANIVFDISIEIRFPGAVDYSMLAYSMPSRTPFRSDGGQHSTVMADTVPR